MSEYEEVAQRHETSLKQLDMVKSALSTPENLQGLRDRIDRDCEQLTVRVLFTKLEKSRASLSRPGIVTDIYRCRLVDIEQRAFIVLKHRKSCEMRFEPDDAYLADKIKLTVNRLGEVVLISTSLTVLRVESEESQTVESMELSQKHIMRKQ